MADFSKLPPPWPTILMRLRVIRGILAGYVVIQQRMTFWKMQWIALAALIMLRGLITGK